MKKRSLKQQALITGASTALVRAMGFVLRLWISRLLGAEALGVMELASGVHMLALTPAAAGLPQAVSRLTAKARDRQGREAVLYAGRRLALILGFALTPIYLILSPFLAKWMGDERALPALLLFAPCMLTVGVSSVYDGFFFGQGRALPPAISEGTEQVVRLMAVAALTGLIPRVTPAYRAALPAFASSLGEAAGLLAILPLAGRMATFRDDPRQKDIRKTLLRLSLPLLLNRLVHTGLRSVCNAVIPLRLMAGGLDRAEAMSRLGMLGGMVMPLMFLPCMASGALSAVGGPAVARCGGKKSGKQADPKAAVFRRGCGHGVRGRTVPSGPVHCPLGLPPAGTDAAAPRRLSPGGDPARPANGRGFDGGPGPAEALPALVSAGQRRPAAVRLAMDAASGHPGHCLGLSGRSWADLIL